MQHQKLMTEAYDRYTNDMSHEDFQDQLDALERVAVFTGNMNYQVENGGFMQWLDNGYASDSVVEFLTRFVEKFDDPSAIKVKQLLSEFLDIKESYAEYEDECDEDADRAMYEELSALDSAYYAVNEDWMKVVEKYLVENSK